jgi:hypothetical protein
MGGVESLLMLRLFDRKRERGQGAEEALREMNVRVALLGEQQL